MKRDSYVRTLYLWLVGRNIDTCLDNTSSFAFLFEDEEKAIEVIKKYANII